MFNKHLISKKIEFFGYFLMCQTLMGKALSNNKQPSLSCQTLNLGFQKNLGYFAIWLLVDTCAITTFSRPLLLSEG